jgi:hypothetical protein
MIIKKLFFTTILILSVFFQINSQITLKAGEGAFEEIISWESGFLGIVQTQGSLTLPKFRHFQYFDINGKLLWNTKVDPKSALFNTAVCNKNANYAYYINKPSNKTEFLNIYQIDKKGTLVEKAINYVGELKKFEPIAKKISIDYYGAYKDGIVVVFSNDDIEYNIVKINNNFEIQIQTFTCESNNKLFKENKLSKPVFILGEDNFYVIQTKLNENMLSTVTYSLPYEDLNKQTKSINNLNITDYNITQIRNVFDENLLKEKDFVDRTYDKNIGGRMYMMPSLEHYISFLETKDGLKAHCISKLYKNGDKKEVEKTELLIFNLELNGDNNEIETENEILFDLQKSIFTELSLTTEKEYLLLFRKEILGAYYIETEEGVKVDLQASISEKALALFLSNKLVGNLPKRCDKILKIDDQYFEVQFDGAINYFGKFKNAIITNI